jgi:hypothetical protein
VPITCANIEKARKYLGYNPQVKIEKGILQFVDWFRQSSAVADRDLFSAQALPPCRNLCRRAVLAFRQSLRPKGTHSNQRANNVMRGFLRIDTPPARCLISARPPGDGGVHARRRQVLRDLIALPSVNPAFLPKDDRAQASNEWRNFWAPAARAGLEVQSDEVLLQPLQSHGAFEADRPHPAALVVLAPHMDTVGVSSVKQFEPVLKRGPPLWTRRCDTKGSRRPCSARSEPWPAPSGAPPAPKSFWWP